MNILLYYLYIILNIFLNSIVDESFKVGDRGFLEPIRRRTTVSITPQEKNSLHSNRSRR